MTRADKIKFKIKIQLYQFSVTWNVIVYHHVQSFFNVEFQSRTLHKLTMYDKLDVKKNLSSLTSAPTLGLFYLKAQY